MNDYGELLDERTVRFERLLPGPVERVWRYLTESQKRALWLCAGDVEPKTGGRVDMHFNNQSLSSDDDIPRPEQYADIPVPLSFNGTVTAWEPYRLLTHTWEFGDEASEVSYELTEVGNKVLLVLTHRRLETVDTVLSVSGGWHTHLDVLEDVLEGREPEAFWKMHAPIEAEYEKRYRG